MALDFNNTCPQIDDCIEDFKHYSEQFIENFIECFLPSDLHYRESIEFKSYVVSKTEELNSNILPLFEKLRELNSEMRDVADKQIGDLEDKISEQEEYISELEKINDEN